MTRSGQPYGFVVLLVGVSFFSPFFLFLSPEESTGDMRTGMWVLDLCSRCFCCQTSTSLSRKLLGVQLDVVARITAWATGGWMRRAGGIWKLRVCLYLRGFSRVDLVVIGVFVCHCLAYGGSCGIYF
ncbi:hypothetical protein BDV23DRAFT_157700 [Aspergillus alliaceus]|uniref:Uncharacterized protein n=1 Tax=Petromyces alliaceus TaxID=209559 RepID=A0A5N7C503_PETAA|nr:hypothetical protein BDV23DRAFT_157700 [Aspergillus alliaceus]